MTMKWDEVCLWRHAASRLRRPHTAPPWTGPVTRNDLDTLPRRWGFDIPHRRLWYLLGKWCDQGLYEYGTSIDLGWLTPRGADFADAVLAVLDGSYQKLTGEAVRVWAVGSSPTDGVLRIVDDALLFLLETPKQRARGGEGCLYEPRGVLAVQKLAGEESAQLWSRLHKAMARQEENRPPA